jgi:phospholipase/lecithinase/hemolysin
MRVPGINHNITALAAAGRSRAALSFECSLALLLIGLMAVSATAGPFTQLFVFGDSLSDVGNIEQATASFPFVPPTPGPYYYDGRFSNGPVYAEFLAAGLELPSVVHSRAGGGNFAHGGAKTSGTGFPNNLVVRDVDDQVGDFLTAQSPDPDALFVVFAGANDLIGGQTNMSIPVNRLATDIGRLITAGARSLLVPNLPPLGYTPRYNDDAATLATYNARTEQFNAALATMLDGLEAGNPAITVYRFDLAALFSEALADPAEFGLTNVTAPAAPGLQPGATSYDTNQIAANPNEYLFWDDLHPTTAVHAVFAERVLELFVLPGDFNRDRVVDAADYAVWRSGLGVSYTPADYDTWRMHFGETATGVGAQAGPASHSSVPEPAALLLALAAVAIRNFTRPARRP